IWVEETPPLQADVEFDAKPDIQWGGFEISQRVLDFKLRIVGAKRYFLRYLDAVLSIAVPHNGTTLQFNDVNTLLPERLVRVGLIDKTAEFRVVGRLKLLQCRRRPKKMVN